MVTVACITYNHGRYLTECLNGIINQVCTFEVEIIVHDDLSTDATRLIIEEYKDKHPNLITIFQAENQYSQGRKPLIDFILPIAKGKYVAFCEGDDYWTDPLKLQKQVDFLERNTEFSFCSHWVNRVSENGEIIKLSELKGKNLLFDKHQILHRYFPPVSLVFRNIDIPYSEDLKAVVNGDAVLIGLLSLYGKGAILDFIGAFYRIHNNGVYSSRTYYKKLKSSVHTRRVMLRANIFDHNAKRELIKEIEMRKVKAVKESLRRFRFFEAIRMLLI